MRSQAIRLFALTLLGSFVAGSVCAEEDTIAAARRIIADWNHPDVGEAIDELGELIAVNPDDAEAVMAMLASDKSLKADTLRAELLVWIARGDETPSWKLKQMAIKPRPMETEQLGALAAKLLSHADPFVRGLAEWALAIRLHMEYECAEERIDGRRIAKPWPDANAPKWYRAWAAIGPEATLELDYVRQAAVVGVHRTTTGLLDAAEKLVKRSKQLTEYARHVAPKSRPTGHERVPGRLWRIEGRRGSVTHRS